MLANLKKFSLPELEEKVLKFWEENEIFKKTLNKNKKNKKFVFFEGPPTANGRPGIHHVLSRSFKDVVLRFKTMSGFFVPRRAGWDTHGLPVEIEVEKKLGLKSKKEIENFGVAEFNEKCKESVWEYKDEWEKITKRIGFWIDLKHPYITYKKDYVESLWWIFSEIHKKKLLYSGHKVVPWCTRCGTALSSHELALGYKTAADDAVYLKFQLEKDQSINKWKTDENFYILCWTTTPWTLPGNVALAVGENISYLLVQSGDEKYILAKERLAILEGVNYKIIGEIIGKDLVGLKYKPLFFIDALQSSASYHIYGADFVNTEDGTGVVHTAVMYGEDDYKLGEKVGLPKVHTVTERGVFHNVNPELDGKYVKDEKTNELIFRYLREKNLLLKTEKYEHEYPFCWRCGTPLLYYARHSWFIKMSALKDKLIKHNKTVNWIPPTIKEGRFGEWLKDLKDWAISRERYWGTPLPIWICQKCKKEKVIGSIRDLNKYLAHSSNKYFLLRHGEALSNKENFLSSYPETKENPLTLKGIAAIEKVAALIKKEKIDFIFSSDLLRAKETALIISEKTGREVIFDKRLREVNFGILNGKDSATYHNTLPTYEAKFNIGPEGGENLRDLRKRLFSFVTDLESKYQNKKILIISHEYCLWLLFSILKGLDYEETVALKESLGGDFVKTGEMIKNVRFEIGPRNILGEIDLHKPYVDEIKINCSCGGEMRRIPEVADVWFDSGAMPFAQNHYPFNKKIDYPADYIVEGVDQTRGWFYTLLAVAVLLSKKAPYKNVISLGLVLDKNGQKMSKSKGNIVNPWEMIEKYGADVVRWYFYTINPPGEPKRFDENDLLKISRQFVSLLYNSAVFYFTYGSKKVKPAFNSTNILDKWIYLRFLETQEEVLRFLGKYEIGKAAKGIEKFVDDLSKWYIRRSRRRFQKPESKSDYQMASQTLYFVLWELSKLLAPFMPFFAELLYKSLSKDKKGSVHLEKLSYSKTLLKTLQKKENKAVLETMEKIRDLASSVLAKRAEVEIKVRQPLGLITLSASMGRELRYKKEEFLNILKEEVNVKKIDISKNVKENFVLDTTITPELKEEGILREVIRIIQGLRQDAGLKPGQKIHLHFSTQDDYLKKLLSKNYSILKKETNAYKIFWGEEKKKFDIKMETKIEDIFLSISLKVFN